MAVRVELGVGARWRTCGFGPTFPLDEVGDPTLSQGGGLRHMVPNGLRDACVTERGQVRYLEPHVQEDENQKIYIFPPFKEDLASAANSWMPTLFLESAGDFPDFGIISVSSKFTCKTRHILAKCPFFTLNSSRTIELYKHNTDPVITILI